MFSAFLKGAFYQLLTCLPMKRPKHLIMLNGAQSTILLRLGDMAHCSVTYRLYKLHVLSLQVPTLQHTSLVISVLFKPKLSFHVSLFIVRFPCIVNS